MKTKYYLRCEITDFSREYETRAKAYVATSIINNKIKKLNKLIKKGIHKNYVCGTGKCMHCNKILSIDITYQHGISKEYEIVLY